VTNDAHRLLLLKVAREAITAHVNGMAPPPVGEHPLASRRGGAFVSIHKAGELRGCIGHIDADDLLIAVVARCAVAAGSTDPRFPAVGRDELPHLAIELSLLGVFERIVGPADVEVGRHGLFVESGRRRGLLLPQVAVEWQWDALTFLDQTCRKAGLSADEWRKGASLWRFEAEVFSESH
jgi:AmmeMemoRadiSam system protein A